MESLSLDAVQSLLNALRDPSPLVRTAALRALVHLPLEADAWWRVARHILTLLEEAPVGERFNQQTLQGIPYQDIIRAAVHVPVFEVRRRLYSLLESPDDTLRCAVAVSLARASDQKAVPTLLELIRSSQPSLPKRIMFQLGKVPYEPDLDFDRKEVARSLSLLNASDFQGTVLSLCRQEPNGQVRFWLSLALAGTGEPGELKRAIRDMAKGRIYLDEFYGDPTLLTTELTRHRDFPDDLTDLKDLLTRAAGDNIHAQQLASDLLIGFEPRTAAHPKAIEESSGGDPDEAASFARELLEHSPYDREQGPLTWDEIEKLRPLDPALANQLVEALFRDLAFHHTEFAFENELVVLISRFDHPIHADIGTLFDCYHHVYDERQLLAWQIAWAAARRGMTELVSAVSPHLQASGESERLAAAQMIEEAARYLNEDFPPQFGGGEPPPDTLPSEPEWIDLRMSMEEPPSAPVSQEAQANSPEELEKPRNGRSVSAPRVVNTGFTSQTQPDELIEPTTPLHTASSYYFWIDIGRPVPQSGERTPVDIPPVPAETVLTVALFAYQDGFLLTPGADIGKLYLHPGGQVYAFGQPLGEQVPDSKNRATRLFFPVRTPSAPGSYSLRCNIYWGQILLQSRLVQVQVVEQEVQVQTQGRAWESFLDYTLTNGMDAGHLTRLEPDMVETHKLSILLNANGDGTHSFHFFGKKELKNDDVRFGEGELFGMIQQARKKLRWASWHNEDEWRTGCDYRYADRQIDLPRLQEDLVSLAKWGHEFYVQVGSRLGGMQVRKLQDLLIEPGYLQIAMKESPNYILPVAMIYDYPLDTFGTQHSLCPEFVEGLRSGQPLENVRCFNGKCPSHGQQEVVCPSGFWGFRHYIGMPLSVKFAPEVPPTIDFDRHLQMVMGEATDLSFLAEHENTITHLKDWLRVQLAKKRQHIFDYLKQSPHLVYFYCHGGLKNDAPFLQFGPTENPELILPSNLVEYVFWEKPRPLVFLNGCHTTAVDPLKALQFIRPLVEECQCAGVIGTEITIFEGLATAFAEEFFRRLLLADGTVGKALRGARLKLLAEGNPLGLVYIPFVLATLHIKDVSANVQTDLLRMRGTEAEIIETEDSIIINGIKLPRRTAE